MSGRQVAVSKGSTGKLFAQIVNGAPYSIFLAANAPEPRRLETDGRAVPGARMHEPRTATVDPADPTGQLPHVS